MVSIHQKFICHQFVTRRLSPSSTPTFPVPRFHTPRTFPTEPQTVAITPFERNRPPQGDPLPHFSQNSVLRIRESVPRESIPQLLPISRQWPPRPTLPSPGVVIPPMGYRPPPPQRCSPSHRALSLPHPSGFTREGILEISLSALKAHQNLALWESQIFLFSGEVTPPSRHCLRVQPPESFFELQGGYEGVTPTPSSLTFLSHQPHYKTSTPAPTLGP